MAKKIKRAGRPELPENERRSQIVPIRFTIQERERLEKNAKKEGMNLSDWIRKRLLSD